MSARSVHPLLMSRTEPSPAAGLTRREWRRRLWHMFPGVLPFCLWPVPHRDPLSPVLWGVMFAVSAAIGAAILIQYRRIRRSDADRERIAAVAGYFFSVVALLVAFPSAVELALALTAILAFGDGTATVAGLVIGGPRLPWNPRKSWSGLAAFVLVGGVLATLVYWGETCNPEALPPIPTLATCALIAGGATLIAAIAESIPSRVNDNIRVGLVGGLALVALHSLLVGW